MNTIAYFAWTLVLFGHSAVWVAFFNRVHAFDIPCRLVRVSEKTFLSVWLLGGAWLAVVTWPISGLGPWQIVNGSRGLGVYAFVCAGVGVYIVVVWVWRRLATTQPRQLVSNHTQCLDVCHEIQSRPCGAFSTRVLDWIPTNQMFELRVHKKVLAVDSLPPSLEGLTIAHVSDLHFSGKIEKSYFDYVIEQTNELAADIVAVTGDVLDTATCLDWLPSTLGRLQSRYGRYFVLGNHDKQLKNESGVRRAIADTGLVDLGRQHVCCEVRGQQVLLSGNELPWFGPPPNLPAEYRDDQMLFRILLSHSPDQLRWAQDRGFHLMLSGHTHGGQVRFPLLGPIVSPSAFGVKYANGVFYEAPTLLHVSRGISAIMPLRLNCAPELAKLELVRRS